METIKKKKTTQKRLRQPVQRGLHCASVREQDVGCSRSSATVAGRADGCPDNCDREEYKKLRILSFRSNKLFVTKIN